MTAHIDIDAIGTAGAELARYPTTAGERVVMGWRRGSGVEVTDRPAHGRARAYLVDRGVCRPAQLAALLSEYLAQARLLDGCPMSGEQIDAILAKTESEALAPLLGEEG